MVRFFAFGICFASSKSFSELAWQIYLVWSGRFFSTICYSCNSFRFVCGPSFTIYTMCRSVGENGKFCFLVTEQKRTIACPAGYFASPSATHREQRWLTIYNHYSQLSGRMKLTKSSFWFHLCVFATRGSPSADAEAELQELLANCKQDWLSFQRATV